MESFLRNWSAAREVGATKIAVSKEIELKAADDLRPVKARGDGLRVFADMWTNVCRHRAVGACMELQLPDLLGSDMLTIEDLSERAACENTSALKSLCDTLVGAGVLEYTPDQRYALTDAGALLQRGLHANVAHIVDAMVSETVSNAWANLSTTIVQKVEPGETVEDEVLTMHCDDLEADAASELKQVVDAFQPSGVRITYWGLENASDILTVLLPNGVVTHVESSSDLVGPIDLLILHRTIAVYGLSEVVDACKSALADDGTILLIDTVEHPANCAKDLYAHAASLPPRPTEEEWKEMWGETEMSAPLYLRDGVVAFQFVPATRI